MNDCEYSAGSIRQFHYYEGLQDTIQEPCLYLQCISFFVARVWLLSSKLLVT